MSASWSKAPPGVAEFFTPCLILAATVATALSQLGLPVGGLPFTIALYLVFDFISFRLGRKVPPLQRLRASFSLPSGSTLTAATSADEGAKAAAQPQPTHAMERRVRAETSPSAKTSPPAASPAAQSKGLRMSMQGRTDIFANAESPIEFENDFFKGRMLFLLRCSPPNPKWDPHFEGKNRMFEMQIQGKLKLLPKGEVYMGGELDERPKQGLVTQTVSKIVMGFAKQMVKSLHYSFGERRPPSDPLEAESPHVTFPLYRVMDWFVVTPEAEAPPSLGGDVVELPEERAARRGGRSPDIEWRTDVTYTMCFHSNTVNFQEWSVINVPGQGSLDLNTFLCKQPVSVVVYDFTASNASAAHKARDKSYMFRCTLSNESPGYVAQPAAVCESPSKMMSGMPRSERGVGVDCLEGDESDDCGMSADREALESAAVGVASSDEQTDHDGLSSSRRLLLSLDRAGTRTMTSGNVLAPSVASAGSSPRKSYYVSVFPTPEDKEASGKGLVKSGDILPLLMEGGDVPATPQNAHHDPATNVAFLGEGSGGGVAMLKGNAMPAGVQVFKVGGGVGTFRSDFFYGGDVVVLQHPISRKFVRIGRAWVLAWSSKPSASKIHFVVKGIDSGRPLAHGQAFSLVSRRWSDWEVGVSKQPSSKLGGWSLGCLNKGKRRNVARLSLLTLVAKPWFDPATDLAGGQGGGVIPALEAEQNAMTISHRGPFEDEASAEEEEEDDDDDDGSDAARSEVDDGLSDSDPECYSDADKAETERRLASYRSFSEDGLSSKAARAMTCYPDDVSSLRVGIPAWVEFFHRDRRQGLLAFVVAVHGVPHPLRPSSSTATKTATDSGNATTTTAETGDNNLSSPARATRTPAWTCLRTGIELSRSVEAYRECIGASRISDSWQSKAPPRVFQHMGNADQSVRLINHEISEIQRWEAYSRSKGKPEFPPAILDPSSSPSAQGDSSLALIAKDDRSTSPSSATGNEDGSILEPVGSASSPGGKSSIADGDTSSPSRLQRSPDRMAGSSSSGTELPASSGASALITSDGASVVHDPARSGASGDPSPACLPRGEQGGGRGKGLTSPYRLLCEAVSAPGELDRHFLSGSSAADLGVTVEASSGTPALGSAVARCLSESHWREEWAVLFPSHVACYPALSMKPSWVLPLKTLFKVSSVSDERCPFPGLRGLRLETIGRAYYLCFANCSSRDNWLSEILRLSKGGTVDPPSVALELPQDHREMYVLKTTQSRAPARLILNARRPGFDIPDGVFKQGNRPGESDAATILSDGSSHQQQQQQPWQLSAEVLRSAFAVSADPGIEQLIPFLDLASTFRKVDLSSLDLDSDEALCFFANLYHLLVMHMLLVLGPSPSAKEWPLNYVQVSYEVGGDVFSLQELEHCVLRGRLPRPNLKDLPKRFAPLPPENDDHYFYRLTKADDRMSLFLNNGSQSNPPVVMLLTPSTMNEQLNSACKAFVDHTVKTDPKRRQILVHKAFQLYARDLKPHGTSKDMVRYGLRFAGRSVVQALSMLDVDISQAHMRYHPYLLKCHENENMTLLDVPDAPA